MSRYLCQFLADNNRTNADVDGSSTPKLFGITPEIGQIFRLYRMIVTVRDGGTIAADKYGKLPELANGVQVGLFKDGEMVQDFTPAPIRSNASWGSYCYDVEAKTWGTGTDFLVARWTFYMAGTYLTLRPGETFGALIRDDLTHLTEHRFMVQGLASD